MDNQKYNKMDKLNQYSGYLKNFSGGMLATSLLQGNDFFAGISAGLYIVGDRINGVSQKAINKHLQSGLEDTLKE